MTARIARPILGIQLLAVALLYSTSASADESPCENVGDRSCSDCYILSAPGGLKAAVDGLECVDIGTDGGEELAWVYYRTFHSDDEPLTTNGCADANGQCTDWKGGGGEH